jgi:steroid delta-isomerase-like uncharacterized protein
VDQWSDEFFEKWRRAWNTSTEDVMDLVTDDIEYWDPTLLEPVTNIQDYACRLDRFFGSISEPLWIPAGPVIFDEVDERHARASEPWSFTGLHTGKLWTGHPASGRRVTTEGVDVYEFRDGLVCRQYSYFDVLDSLRQLGVEPKGSVRRETVTATFGPVEPDPALELAGTRLGATVARGRRLLGRLPGSSLLGT